MALQSPTLPDAVHRRMTALTDRGNERMENGDLDGALAEFEEALRLVPEPRRIWKASTWLHASIGDCQFQLGRFEDALDSMVEARNCPDGLANPFILLRMGQSLYELGDLDAAKQAFTQAYMLEGEEIFEESDPKYLAFLTGAVKLTP